MRNLMFILICLLVHFSCTNNYDTDRNIELILLGYDFKASDSQHVSSTHYLIKNNELFEISKIEEAIDTAKILNYRLDQINPIIDSLPAFEYHSQNRIGNRDSKNDETPWFVKILYKDGSQVEIGSNNLPSEFWNYDKIVVNVLRYLYNINLRY